MNNISNKTDIDISWHQASQKIRDAVLGYQDMHKRSCEDIAERLGCTINIANGLLYSNVNLSYAMANLIENRLGIDITTFKSQLGSASTLFNAGKNTNILYRVSGSNMSDSEMDEINAIKKHLPRMEKMRECGYRMEYADIEHQTFKNNLLFLDTCMPEFIADCLATDNTSQVSLTTEEIVKAVANKNPFNFCGNKVLAFYEHKMKSFLLDAALGMTPGKEWDGRYDANGGYIVVKRDGDIVCYHFYNRNEVEDYLYHNTRFERASRSRYDFGYLFRGEDGQVYIRLNLQVRFTK